MSERGLRSAPVEPLSYKAWQRVEAAVFARIDDGAVFSMPLPFMPHRSYAVPRSRRSLRWHWLVSIGFSASAAAAASAIHVARSAGPTLDEGVWIATATEATATEATATEATATQTAVAAPLPAAPVVATPHADVHGVTGAETRDLAVVSRGAVRAARAKSTPPEQATAHPDRKSRFDRAARLESQNPAEALDGYLALARGDDGWAANALYAAARLALDRGDQGTSLRLLEDYFARFPEGENIVDVEALRAWLGAAPGPSASSTRPAPISSP